MANYSVIEYLGEQRGSKCGYCKQEDKYNSYGFWAHKLLPEDYQGLINRNWRRSGQYCYLPMNSDTCCPLYTIKCEAKDFKLNKSHKKILKRMKKFLSDGIKMKDDKSDIKSSEESEIGFGQEQMPLNVQTSDIVMSELNTSAITKKALGKPKPKDNEITSLEIEKSLKVPSNAINASELSECDKPKPKKAKLIRLEHKINKLAEKGLKLQDVQSKAAPTAEKSLEDFLAEEPINGKHQLKVILIPAKDGVNEAIFKLYQKYQVTIHNDPPEKVNVRSYERFLAKSPMQLVKDYNTPPDGYGSFHQQYWLDGVLIAVGVIDILPECVSSVYFYYDPDYSFLSLGTYASLREVALTRELNKKCPQLSNYYLGFYIPTCPKMRYKKNIKPSFLLCPEVFTWHSLDDQLSAEIDAVSCKRINETGQDSDKVTNDDLQYVLVIAERTVCTYDDYTSMAGRPRKLKNDNQEVLEYASKVGKSLSQRMLLFRY
ncbi:unnamed protein product [Diamesa serratosioi]